MKPYHKVIRFGIASLEVVEANELDGRLSGGRHGEATMKSGSGRLVPPDGVTVSAKIRGVPRESRTFSFEMYETRPGPSTDRWLAVMLLMKHRMAITQGSYYLTKFTSCMSCQINLKIYCQMFSGGRLIKQDV
jgi:hypothetical protein